MNEVFILEHEFDFKESIHEITSIAIEYRYDIEDSKCVGDFIISGDYRLHEISINREDFSFKLPFETEIRSNINLDSLEVEITDFTYEFTDNTLTVHIEYNINGEQAFIEFAEEADLEEFLKVNDAEVIDFSEEKRIAEIEELATIPETDEESAIIEEASATTDEIIKTSETNEKPDDAEEERISESEELVTAPEVKDELKETEIEAESESETEITEIKKESIEDFVENNIPNFIRNEENTTKEVSSYELEGEKLVETMDNKAIDIDEVPLYKLPEETEIPQTITQEPRIDGESIIESINSEENYVTYYVHTVTTADSFESISNQYNVSVSYIKKINNIEELELGMKLIIPDEEN